MGKYFRIKKQNVDINNGAIEKKSVTTSNKQALSTGFFNMFAFFAFFATFFLLFFAVIILTSYLSARIGHPEITFFNYAINWIRETFLFFKDTYKQYPGLSNALEWGMRLGA